MRVRTAASASSRDGRGVAGAGAARTCSDNCCLGNDFTMASINTLRWTARRQIGPRRVGAPVLHRVLLHEENGRCNPRLPDLHGGPAKPDAPLLVTRSASIYVSLPPGQSTGRGPGAPKKSKMAYTHRILQLAANV